MNFNIFKSYPLGFGALFFTQAFFNFGFYGLKSFFIFYVVAHFSLLESEAITLFATLMSLSYAATLVGGWIADKSLGTQHAIVLGGLLQALGVFLLFFPSQEICFVSLALICLGSGFFKPNLSTAVGMLFENAKDPCKDKSYSMFYMAMNLGGLLAPLVCGLISRMPGGYYNGLLVLIVFLIGGAFLSYSSVRFKGSVTLSPSIFFQPIFVGLYIVILIFFFYLLFKYYQLFTHLLGTISLGSFIYLGAIFYQCSLEERKNILSISLYILLFTFFCSLFEQAGSSLLLFFDKAVDRDIIGTKIPSSALLSLSPIFVLVCSPFLILFSNKVLENKKTINGLIKAGMGFLLTGLSFIILALSCITSRTLVPMGWIICALFVQTLGELFIVPVGFSNISKLSPPRFRGVMMSFWFMAIAYGHYFAGLIAQFSVKNSAMVEGSLETYSSFFLNLSLLPCIVGFLLLLSYPLQQVRILPKKIPQFRQG